MVYVKQTAKSSIPAISLEELKEHLKVSDPAVDAQVERIERMATATIEQWTSTIMMEGTYEQALDARDLADLPGRMIELARKPVSSIVSVDYYTLNDAQTAYASFNYVLDSTGGRLLLKQGASWPSSVRTYRGFVINFKAGFSSSDPSVIPQQLRRAVLILAGHFWMNPSAILTGTISKETELGVRDVLAQYNRANVF